MNRVLKLSTLELLLGMIIISKIITIIVFANQFG